MAEEMLWKQIADIIEDFDGGPDSEAARTQARLAKLREISKEPKLTREEIGDFSLRFAAEIQQIADSTSAYRDEHFASEERYRESGSIESPHTFTFTLGDWRYRLHSSRDGDRATLRLSCRQIDPTLPEDYYRKFEKREKDNPDLWAFSIGVVAISKGSKTYGSEMQYEGPDPNGDISVGRLKLINTQRTVTGIENTIHDFRRRSRPNLDHLQW